MDQTLPSPILLHCCCAICSCAIIESLLTEKVSVKLFFFNPNIHPEPEYERRKAELIRYASSRSVPFIDVEYQPNIWFDHIQGYESTPERGDRCRLCFELRLTTTAQYAAANRFSHFATTLSISRHKNIDQIHAAGIKAANTVPGTIFLPINWRKDGGTIRMESLSKTHNFYRQNYCGCVFSQPQTNK